MVQRQRDARLLRALLQLPAPPGVSLPKWRKWAEQHVAPAVRQVVRDLGQSITGPVALAADLDERAARDYTESARRHEKHTKKISIDTSMLYEVAQGAVELQGYDGGPARGPCVQLIVTDARGITTLSYDDIVELRDDLDDWITRVDARHKRAPEA